MTSQSAWCAVRLRTQRVSGKLEPEESRKEVAMGSPDQPRDRRGRFASRGEAPAEDRREEEADRKRIEKAKAAAKLSDVRQELSETMTELNRIGLRGIRPTRKDDPY